MLAIYLNDHLAAATAARDLARRAAGSNRGSPYGTVLDRLAGEIEEDRKTLLEVMHAMGARVDQIKLLVARGGEKLGRLKLNGKLVGYSPLSRLEEIELLMLGVTGKFALWRSLAALAPREPRLEPFDFALLARRAEGQREELEAHRLRAAAEAFI